MIRFSLLILLCLIGPLALYAQHSIDPEVEARLEESAQQPLRDYEAQLDEEWNRYRETLVAAAGPVLPQDSLALVALYNAADGPNWTNNTNWLTGPVDSWHGISVSGNRVTGIALSNNELSGSIPVEIGDLTDLLVLRLHVNQLTGPIPVEIGNLTKLTSLRVNSNQLTGSIPTELGNLSNLSILFLSTNNLTGPIPAELGDLANLTSLYLYTNNLTGPIPAELGDLTNLIYLLIGTNQVSGTIPVELGNLSNLGYLSVNSNQLEGPIPVEIGNLINLENLYISSSQLTGGLPVEIGNLINLTDLRIANTQLGGSIPAGLGNLTNLTILDLARNQFIGPIPAGLGNLTELTYLHMSNNQLTGPIPSGLGNLTRLTYLAVHNNALTGTLPMGIGNLVDLDFIFIDNNDMSGALPLSLIALSGLRSFYFDLTTLCELSDSAFQIWLQGIVDLESTDILCLAPPFRITLNKVIRTANGTKKAKIKWNPSHVNKGKLDFYVGEDPDGSFLKRTSNDGKIKLKLPTGQFPSDGPFFILACEKNSTTVCSYPVAADFSGVAPDFNEPEDDPEEETVAGKTAATETLPEALTLAGNHPNPFNPTTTIRYVLPEGGLVRLRVYDMLGREVEVLVDGHQEGGAHRVVFDASPLPSGTYIYRLEAGGQVQTARMLLIK